MKIWVYLNGIQQGPYTLEELSQLPITASKPVWYEGLDQWLPAHEAPVTAPLFATPEYEHETERPTCESSVLSVQSQRSSAAVDAQPCPPTFVGWSVFVLICCFPIGGVLGLVFSSLTGSAYRSGDYAKAARMSECAEWTVIISIVIGLVLAPLAPFLL